MAFYGESQWPPTAGAGYDVGAGAGTQSTWDHQTPPSRSGASSTNPREEPSAFWYQFQEVEKAWSEMIKSGKIQPGMGMPPGGRREFQPPFPPGPARFHPDFEPRIPGGPGRPHSPGFGAGRGGPGHPSSNLQNFYASQRHQPSRGSNDAEQMQQHKRRLAAQRERELRNYHQEQQFNRTAAFPPGPADMNAGSVNPNAARPDRTFSPSGTAEVPHHELIARQQSALYGKGPFGDAAGYIDENGTPRQGLPVHHGGPPNLRGPSPLTYEYGRNQPVHQDPAGGPPSAVDPVSSSSIGGVQPRERTSSNASPQSNPSGGRGPLEQANRTSNSSPGNGSPQNGRPPPGKTVAPIGTRPSAAQQGSAANPSSLTKQQSTTPLSYTASAGETPSTSSGGASNNNNNNPTSATASAEGSSGLSNWGQRSGPWGSSKTQTSVWG